MFLKSGAAVDTDFLDRSRSIRIQLSFSEVSEADLKRLEDGHRIRIEREARNGRITLAKVYNGPGKGTFLVVTRVPRDHRYTKLVIDDTLKSGLPSEVIAANVKATYPEVAHKLNDKINRAAVRREIAAIMESLGEDDFVTGDDSLPTGMDKSIAPLLPESIYIPAVKELNEELKTTSTATFGRLLSLLFGQIVCHQLRDRLIAKANEVVVASGADPSGKTLKGMRANGAVQDLWKRARVAREQYAQGLCEWGDLDATVSAFFARSTSGAMRRMKIELLQELRKDDIYVWERGAIEDYYPPLENNESSNKNDRARYFCERHVTAEDIKGLAVFKDSDECEFEAIFESLFRSIPSGDRTQSFIPKQAESNGLTQSSR